uniref:Uncharacterized protein n=1 Tax=Arundo donax TaxID=35708 RepID=A0A0A9DKB9_ARUDO
MHYLTFAAHSTPLEDLALIIAQPLQITGKLCIFHILHVSPIQILSSVSHIRFM